MSDVTLPKLTPFRRFFRRLVRGVFALLAWLFVDLEIDGKDNMPQAGPLLVIVNHLGHADAALMMIHGPPNMEGIVNSKWQEHFLLGPVGAGYGVIWVNPFTPDRRMLLTALDALKEGRIVGIAPEGRISEKKELEQGRNGAAFLALRSGAPVIPVVFEGTEAVLDNMVKLKRTKVRMTIGEVFKVAQTGNRRADMHAGTERMMQRLARLLPGKYRGVYSEGGS